MITMNDIQIFVTTYNRPNLLKLTLKSVLAQTDPVLHIAVLDNGAFSKTKKQMSAFSKEGIQYHDTSHLGSFGNLLYAQQILNKKYVMLLHDDDLIHSDYFSLVLKVINKNKNINLLTCRTIPWAVEDRPRPHPTLCSLGHLFSQQEYATFVYNSGHPSYSLAIYNSERFKSIDILENFNTFGKWGDVPLMIKIIRDGYAAVLMDTCGWMGVHSGQDTNTTSTRPTYQSWIERECLFAELLGDDYRTLSGLSFCLQNYRRLRSGFKRRISKEVSFNQYLKKARESAALTKRGELFRFFSPKWLQKIFQRKMKHYYLAKQKELI